MSSFLAGFWRDEDDPDKRPMFVDLLFVADKKIFEAVVKEMNRIGSLMTKVADLKNREDYMDHLEEVRELKDKMRIDSELPFARASAPRTKPRPICSSPYTLYVGCTDLKGAARGDGAQEFVDTLLSGFQSDTKEYVGRLRVFLELAEETVRWVIKKEKTTVLKHHFGFYDAPAILSCLPK